MTLWDKYSESHPELISRLELVDEKSRRKFIKKLQKERDRDNFISIITELQFIEFFVKEGFHVEYEKEYLFEGGKKITPDFTLSKYNEKTIAEVLRLNPTKKDKKRNDFESFLFEAIEKIRKGCLVRIKFIDEYYESDLYDLNFIAQELEKWITNDFYLNSELTLYRNLIFRIIAIDDSLEHACVYGNFNSIDIDTRRLNSEKSQFVTKIEKYEAFISEMAFPYLICLKIDFHAGINENEMFRTMYGDLLFYDYVPKHESQLNGFYYTNDIAKRNLSGVILLGDNNNVYYFNNYFLLNRLKQTIKNEFLKYQFVRNGFNKLVYLREVPKQIDGQTQTHGKTIKSDWLTGRTGDQHCDEHHGEKL